MTKQHELTLEHSALLRRYVDESRFSPGDPCCESFAAPEALRELDALELSLVEQLTEDEAAQILEGVVDGQRWAANRLAARGIVTTVRRAAACVLAARALGSAWGRLYNESLAMPTRDQRLFAAFPTLFEQLSSKGRLLSLTGAAFSGIDLDRDPDVFRCEGTLVGFHPWLWSSPELLAALAEAAATPGVQVWVAPDPHRLPIPNHCPDLALREAQLWGVNLTLENVDSLDPHDQSRSFHAPVDRHPFDEQALPLLGTWIDARAESPRRIFYVQEVKPADPGDESDRFVRIRALHSERDTRHRAFTHVDGKIEIYPETSWAPSAGAPNARLGTPTATRKLWRVDASGGMPDSLWQRLVGAYYRRNELVAEHFAALGAAPAAA